MARASRRIPWYAWIVALWLLGTIYFIGYLPNAHRGGQSGKPGIPKHPKPSPPLHPEGSGHKPGIPAGHDTHTINEEHSQPPEKPLHTTHPHHDMPGLDACHDAHPDIKLLLVKDEPAEHTDTENICPICGHKEHHTYAKEQGHTLAQCDNCGFLYINPMPFGIPPNKTFHERWVDKKVAAMVQKFTEFFSEEQRQAIENWLDIGAGNGELLKGISKEAPHINATGLENSDYKIAGAKAHGIHHVKRDLNTIEEKFDVVSVMNVLSHVTRPVSFFSAISRLLKPDGCIFMSTGNAADIEEHQNPGRKGDKFSLPDHLCFAGKRHVYTALCRAGLNVTEYREYDHFWHNYPPLSPKGPFRAVYVKACRVPGVDRPWFDGERQVQ